MLALYVDPFLSRHRFLLDAVLRRDGQETLYPGYRLWPSERGPMALVPESGDGSTTCQIRDYLDSSESQYRIGRMVIAPRPRRTKTSPHESDGLNCQAGIPTRRSEQPWHVIRHELTSPRDNQAGMAAWERWCRSNRRGMPGSVPKI